MGQAACARAGARDYGGYANIAYFLSHLQTQLSLWGAHELRIILITVEIHEAYTGDACATNGTPAPRTASQRPSTLSHTYHQVLSAGDGTATLGSERLPYTQCLSEVP